MALCIHKVSYPFYFPLRKHTRVIYLDFYSCYKDNFQLIEAIRTNIHNLCSVTKGFGA